MKLTEEIQKRIREEEGKLKIQEYINPHSRNGDPTTPNIYFEIDKDQNKGILMIQGKSKGNDVMQTYEPVIDFFDKNKKNIIEIDIEIGFEYLNSASVKAILIILLRNTEIKKNIKWYYKEDDEDIEDKGDDIQDVYQNSLKKKKEIVEKTGNKIKPVISNVFVSFEIIEKNEEDLKGFQNTVKKLVMFTI